MSYRTVNGVVPGGSGVGPPGPPGLIQNPYPGILTLTPSTDQTNFIINNAAGVQQLSFNTTTGTLSGISANFDTLTFDKETVESLTVKPATDGTAFVIEDAAGTGVFEVNTTSGLTVVGNSSFTPVTDGVAFTINSAAGGTVFSANTATGIITVPDIQATSTVTAQQVDTTNLAVSSTSSLGSATTTNLIIEPIANGQVFSINAAGGAGQLSFNTASNALSGNGTINTSTINSGSVNIRPSTDGQIFSINAANGTGLLSFNSGSNAINSGGSINIVNVNGRNFNINPTTNGQVLTINNASNSNVLNVNTSTDTLTVAGTISAATVNVSGNTTLAATTTTTLQSNGVTIQPKTDGTTFTIENAAGTGQLTFNTTTGTLTTPIIDTEGATIKPATDSQVFTIENAAGTSQLNFNTSTNTLTGTGTLSIPNIITASNLTGNSLTVKNLTVTPATDGQIITVTNAAGTKTILFVNSSTGLVEVVGNFVTAGGGQVTSTGGVAIPMVTDGTALGIVDSKSNTLLTFNTSQNQLGMPQDYSSVALKTGNTYGYLWTNYLGSGDGTGDTLNLAFNYYVSSPVGGGSTTTPVIYDAGYAPSMLSLSNGNIEFSIAPSVNTVPKIVLYCNSTGLVPAYNASFNLGSSTNAFGTGYLTNLSLTSNILPTTNNTSNLGSSTSLFSNIYTSTATIGAVTVQNGSYLMFTGGDIVLGQSSSSTDWNVRPENATYGSVGTNGNPWGTCYAVQWANPSDKRLKKNIEENQLGLDFINKVNTVSFNYNYANKKHQSKRYGVVAQELHDTIVSEGIDFAGLVPPTEEDEFYAVDYTQFIAPLIKAVQEQSKKIEMLEAKLYFLETQDAMRSESPKSGASNQSFDHIQDSDLGEFTV